MRTLILYTSKTGNTKKYAEDIAQAVNGDVFPLKKYKWKDVGDYDSIVFGGWVMGGKIQGIDDFLSHYDEISDKNILVFSSGMGFVTSESRDRLISGNVLDIYHIRYYQLRGSFDYSKLHFPYNFMINTSLRALRKDPDSAQDLSMVENLKETPLEFYDQQGIDRIISVLHRLSAVGDPK
ncbi:MAG: flavodoxin domain-containing protein [Candidatus Enteromonas sp.]|nr:flavodoxin domain-containing protein [bacterium]MDY6101011.1 flavodoxin domain-containing protein [Candidatus Enteromonas sp.]